MLKGKTVVVGVTGGIAAYKTCEVVSRLVKLGADVWVVMTKEAVELVTPLTFRTLSNNPVIINLFDPGLSSLPIPHITVSEKADLVLIAPCTANVIGKLAGGIADDALTTMVMAANTPKIIAPAMNPNMWNNPVVGENVEKLKKLKYAFIGPCEGRLACGVEDIGRMAEPEEIVAMVLCRLVKKQDLKGKHVLVTAGGTREAIDPVRYISNRSSGKMGFAIAEAARERGAEVTLISAPTNLADPDGVKIVKIETAAEMLVAVEEKYPTTDVVVMAAAIADFRLIEVPKEKIKKAVSRKPLVIGIEPTDDILKTLAKRKDRKGKIHVGFALETDDPIKNAKQKLKEKDLDFIVVNDPSTFDSDMIKFALLDNNSKNRELLKQSKQQASNCILDKVLALMTVIK